MADDDTRPGPPETLEQTMARISQHGRAQAAQVGPEPQAAQADVAVPPARSPAPATSGMSTGQRTLVAVASIVSGIALVTAIAIAAVSVIDVMTTPDASDIAAPDAAEPDSAEPDSAEPEPIDDIWVAYPGDAYTDDRIAVSQPSAEEVAVSAASLEREVEEALTAEFGLVWTTATEPTLDSLGNGYGGDSMLLQFDQGVSEGTATVNDPTARKRAVDIIRGITASYGMDDPSLANEVYLGDDTASIERFGAPSIDDQAVYTFYDSDGLSDGYAFVASVYDRTVPTQPGFADDFTFSPESAAAGSFTVALQGWSYGLLAEADRDEFVERLAPYAGLEKPEPR